MKATSRISIVIVTCFAFSCTMNKQEHLELGQPQTYLNLRIFPVHANRVFLDNRKNIGNLLTLKEAVDQGKVVISEHTTPSTPGGEAQPDVDTLFIENLSSDSVFIIDGETVHGGLQDRMIGNDVVLKPHSGRLDLSVFCVEQGRWSGDQDLFSVVEHSLPPKNVRMSERVEVQDQEQVWDEVKVSLDINGVSSPSEALYDLKTDNKFQQNVRLYTEKLADVFSRQDNVIGMLVIAGDEVIGCDLFATPRLFSKHYPNLLQSYAAQATTAGDQTIKPEEIGNYWRRVMGTIKKKGGFLGTRDSNRRSDALHFSM